LYESFVDTLIKPTIKINTKKYATKLQFFLLKPIKKPMTKDKYCASVKKTIFFQAQYLNNNKI